MMDSAIGENRLLGYYAAFMLCNVAEEKDVCSYFNASRKDSLCNNPYHDLKECHLDN